MTDQEMEEFNSAVRMSDFNSANAVVFADNTKMTGGFAALERDLEVLVTAGANRVSAIGKRADGTLDKRAAQNNLYALLRKIIETAKMIKKEEPDFTNTFKIRRGTLSGQELLDAAAGFASMLTAQVIDKFTEYGLTQATPANFTDKIAAFEAARSQQNAGMSSGVSATADTRAAVRRLMNTRRTLAQIGANILEAADDAGLLEAWRSACRVESRRKKSDETPPVHDENPPVL